MGRWVFLGSFWCFAFLSDVNITFVKCKKEKPTLDGFPRQKAVVFPTRLHSGCQQFDLKLKVLKMENSSVQSPLDVDPSMEYACFCIFFGASGRLLFCMISTVHSYCLRWASLVGSSSAIPLHKHTFFISGLCLTGLSSMPGKCCYNDLFKFLIVIIGKKMYSH